MDGDVNVLCTTGYRPPRRGVCTPLLRIGLWGGWYGPAVAMKVDARGRQPYNRWLAH
jgi:hypothetical protein